MFTFKGGKTRLIFKNISSPLEKGIFCSNKDLPMSDESSRAFYPFELLIISIWEILSHRCFANRSIRQQSEEKKSVCELVLEQSSNKKITTNLEKTKQCESFLWRAVENCVFNAVLGIILRRQQHTCVSIVRLFKLRINLALFICIFELFHYSFLHDRLGVSRWCIDVIRDELRHQPRRPIDFDSIRRYWHASRSSPYGDLSPCRHWSRTITSNRHP